MEHEEVIIDSFTVVGLSTRANNTDEKSTNDIRKLRMEFLLSNMGDEVQNRISDDIYCVYTDFAGGAYDDYTIILGYKVANTNGINGIGSKYRSVEVEGGKYYKYIAEGEVPQCVFETWRYIWDSDIKRRFTTDFDVFGEHAVLDSQKGQVITYLSVE